MRVTSEGRTFWFSSDFLPDRHHVPLAWIPAFDLYPLDTLEAKRMLLPRAAEEGWVVAFTHDAPRAGRIALADGRFHFEELAAT